jgi:hypothetical protein
VSVHTGYNANCRSGKTHQPDVRNTRKVAISSTGQELSMKTNQTTPWSRVRLEKPTVRQLVKKFPIILWNMTVHYRVHNSPSFVPIQPISSHLSKRFPSALFPSGFLTKTLQAPLLSSTAPRPSYRVVPDGRSGARILLEAIFFFPKCPDPLLGPPSLLLNGYQGSSPRVKWPEHQDNHSFASSAEVENEWSCTSTPPV